MRRNATVHDACIVVASVLTACASGELVAGTQDECYDLQKECAAWAAEGECLRNLGFMRLYACRVSRLGDGRGRVTF